MSQPQPVALSGPTARKTLHPPPRVQVAALCLRAAPGGGAEVLLITSRGTGRWVLPKGWPMADRSLPEAAAQEAWEEAGVRGTVAEDRLGSYAAEKLMADGLSLPCRVQVYPLRVRDIADAFPEAGQRIRRWVRPADAAGMVREPELRSLLAGLGARAGGAQCMAEPAADPAGDSAPLQAPDTDQGGRRGR